MTSLSTESLFLAGFTLAHATWSVSDTAADELLCPLAIIEDGDERRLLRFEADSQEQAIEAAKTAMTEWQQNASTFAFAREGQWRPKGANTQPEDVLTVEFWAPGMEAPQALLQPFARASTGAPFMVAASPVLVLSGRMFSPRDTQPALDVVRQGIDSHSRVAPLWATWRNTAWHAA